MSLSEYKFKKNWMGRLVLYLKEYNRYRPATRIDTFFLGNIKNVINKENEWLTGEYALITGVLLSDLVYLKVSEWDCLLTQYKCEYRYAKEADIVLEYLISSAR